MSQTDCKTLYHFTDTDHLPSILRNGLIPQRGNNTQLIGDEREAVFLCDFESVGRWRIILNKPVLLKVCNITYYNDYEYDGYREYLVDMRIPPENIEVISLCYNSCEKDMFILCSSYLTYISDFTVRCARYYNNSQRTNEDLLDLRRQAIAITFVLPHLDYTVTSLHTWEKQLVQEGDDGEYTFCDCYNGTKMRLWQQLIAYEDDLIAPLRKEIYDFVAKTFPFANELSTGGWNASDFTQSLLPVRDMTVKVVETTEHKTTLFSTEWS